MSKLAEKIVVEVERRDVSGKNACRRIRAAGQIPGNVYGLDRPPFSVVVSPKRVAEILRLESGGNTIFSLSLKGESRTREAMIRELQRDPLTELPVHVDFIRVDATKRLHVRVPVRLVGTPVGVKIEGGIVDFITRELDVECLPGNIPEHLDVDVTELHLNQHVSVGDLKVPEGVIVTLDGDTILAVVNAPMAEEEVTPAEDAVEAVPEDGAKKDEAKPESGEG